MANSMKFVVEHFLLGRTSDSSLERFTQDGGVSIDVWFAFANDFDRPRRILLAPVPGTSSTLMAGSVHRQLLAYRSLKDVAAARTGVATLDAYVAATVNFDELLDVILPLTAWWKLAGLHELRTAAAAADLLKTVIQQRLGKTQSSEFLRGQKAADRKLAKQLYEAAPVFSLIGALLLAKGNEGHDLPGIVPAGLPPNTRSFAAAWAEQNGQLIADLVSNRLLKRSIDPAKGAGAAKTTFKQFLDQTQQIQRVFMDRATSVSDYEALGTIKADAATRVFDISCRNVTWAVVDTGIDATHPAFVDQDSTEKKKSSRVAKIFDFTKVEQIRSFDLTVGKAGSQDRNTEIARVVDVLCQVPGRNATREFRTLARKNLGLIALQLENGLDADWGLIEPLLQLDDAAPDSLPSDHGTHVAGTLGADWREGRRGPDGKLPKKLAGVCPDIRLYDFRVIEAGNEESVESSVIAAMDFIRYLNSKAGTNQLEVSGVNMSLSIPHDVRAYGCGATPVCVASDRLADSGVVVVAAAGNRGWSDEEFGFGQFLFCSVTDPGNAHKVITVGSTHRLRPHQYGVSFFSSRGPTGDGRAKPDLVAPGEKIEGPVRGEAMASFDGTSMAAPFVSGAAAMLISRHKELLGNPARVKEILCGTATDLGRERYFQGHGLVDVLRALQSV